MAEQLESEIMEKLEEQIGECLGLERAAQIAVEKLSSKGLLEGVEAQMQRMKAEAAGHEKKLQDLIEQVAEPQGLNSQSIEGHAEETVQKVTGMMKTYLGEDPEVQDALEFLCLAEGGEITHYEILSSLAGETNSKKFADTVKSILKEEKKHLQLCTKLAKRNAAD
jgi:ferritin-like metal-binding protein YciE